MAFDNVLGSYIVIKISKNRKKSRAIYDLLWSCLIKLFYSVAIEAILGETRSFPHNGSFSIRKVNIPVLMDELKFSQFY